MKKELNKWQFLFHWGNCCFNPYKRQLQFAILKFTSFPPEGMMFTKKNYKGFFIEKTWESFNFNINF